MSEPVVLSTPVAWRRPMVGRDTDEEHRQATYLELFFDLCFVVAVAQASSGLHHAISEDHVADGVLAYAMVFFAVWWAWMNFTWFASAYDTDDVLYRLTTFVQITGALVFAAGVPSAMADRDFTVATYGYVVMRLALVTQWLRAAHDDPERRQACLCFAAGVALVQLGWVARLALPESLDTASFAVLVLAELAVPLVAERVAPTTWHRFHIAERYGLFTLIVLGETVLAATIAIQSALDADTSLDDLAAIIIGGLLTVFAMWWLYFSKEPGRFLTSLRAGFVWGYGHFFIFASAAAVGAGLAVNVDHVIGKAHIGAATSAASFTVPVALWLLAVWALQWVPHHVDRRHFVLAPICAVGVLLATFAPRSILVTGVLLAALVTGGTLVALSESRPASTGSGGG